MALIYVCTLNVILALFFVSLLQADRQQIALNGSGTFISPNYPSHYPDHSDIVWTISAPEGHVVQLRIKDFQLADSPTCSDYFKVLDGTIDNDEHRIYYRCGSNVTWQNYIESRIHIMTVIFFSDGSGTAIGFMVDYSHTPYEVEFMLIADHTDRDILALNMLRQWSSGPIVFPKQPEGRLVGELEFDPVMKQIYFTDEENKTLWRMNIDASGEELLIEGERNVRGFTLNPRSRNLYYIAGYDIIASRMNGTVRYRFGEGSERTRDLTADYISSYVFWASGDNTAARIIRSRGDGTDAKTITSDLGDPRGLTVHYSKDGTITLYVCDSLQSTIRRFDIDGNDKGDVIAPTGAIHKPLSITLDSWENIYWTERNKYSLEVLDPHGVHYEVAYVLQKRRNLADLTICSNTVSDRAPPQCENSCDAKNLCLPVPLSSFKCIPVLPTIRNCPENINRSTGSWSTKVWWHEPFAEWPRQPSHTFNSSHVPGSFFDVGTTKVEYFFTDELGNTVECIFTVTVTRPSWEEVGILLAVSAVFILAVVFIGVVMFHIGRRFGRRQQQGRDDLLQHEGADEPVEGNIAEPDDQAPIIGHREEQQPEQPGNDPEQNRREAEPAHGNIAVPGDQAPLIDPGEEQQPERLLGNWQYLRRLF